MSSIQPVTQPGVFPSLAPGPIATDGSILGIARTDTSSNFPAIYFTTYDSSLHQVGTDHQVATTSLNGAVAMFWAPSPVSESQGGEFGLFYQRPDATLVLQRVDRTGNAIGSPIPMPHAWTFNDEFDVTWDAAKNAYAVAHVVTGARDLGLWLSLISPSGGIVSDFNVSVFAGSQTFPRVTSLADGTVAVMWSRSASTPPVVSVSFVKGTDISTAVVANKVINSPRIASNGSSVLVVYSAAKTGGGTELRDIIVDESGTILTPDSSFMSGTGDDIAPLSLTFNPALSEYAMVYLDASSGFQFFGDVRLRRFTSISATPSDTLLSPDPNHSRLPAPFPVVFIDDSYVAAIENVISVTQGSESYLVKDCPFVAHATADHPVWRVFVPVTFTATGGGGTPGYTYAWDFGDLASATGATVQHTYLLPGTYTVMLTGTDAAGAKSITKITVQITNGFRRHVAHH